MAIRTINYSVSKDGITPKSEQSAYLQGETNVTDVVFTLSADLYEAISGLEGDTRYRIEGTDGAGGFYSSEFLMLNATDYTVTFHITEDISAAGGLALLHLVISKLRTDEDGNVTEENTLYSFHAKIRFTSTSSGNTSEHLYKQGLSGALQATLLAKESAEDSKTMAFVYKENARKSSERAETAESEAKTARDGAVTAKDLANEDRNAAAISAKNAANYAELAMAAKDDVNIMASEMEKIAGNINELAAKAAASATSAQESAEEVAEALAELPTTPDYIIAEAKRVAANVQATRTAKSLVFPITSDYHLFDGNSTYDNSLLSAKYAGMGIRELDKLIHLDFVGNLGDYTWGAEDFTAEQVMKDLTLVKEATNNTNKEIWCIGNHDLNYGKNRDRLLTLDETYNHIGANSDGVKPYENIERGYGYLDFENQKIRVIYLNTCDASDFETKDGETARSEWISPTQIQWVADTALNFSNKEKPSDWGIVIIGHHPLHYSYDCFSKLMQVLEAYKDGLSGSLNSTKYIDENGTYVKEPIIYDFTAGERAEIICNIHGHTHNCSSSKISSSSWTGSTEVEPWLWRFSIPQICAGRYNTGYENFKNNEIGKQNYAELDESGNPIYHTKEAGTAKATSFCVVNIDRKNKKIYAHIFGAGIDRTFSYDDTEVATYSVTNNLTNCVNSNSATLVEEGQPYNATITANSGYILDSVSVTMGDEIVDVADGAINIANVTGDIVITAIAVEEETATYTNQIPISTDVDGNIYNETGYKNDYKLGSTAGEDVTATGYVTTGYIPIGYGSDKTARGEQVIYLQGIEALLTDGNVRVAFYCADKSFIGISAATAWISPEEDAGTSAKVVYALDDNGYVASIDISGSSGYNHANLSKDTAYFRISAPGIDADSIITVNEPIQQVTTEGTEG